MAAALPPGEHARDYAGIAEQYARDVVAGKIVACKWVKLACARHLKDRKRSGRDWPYHFDRWHADDVCDFIEKLPHIEGTWDTPGIWLEDPQIFILVVVFGWRKADGRRRFTTVYIEMARKGAKALDLDTQIPTPDGWALMRDLRIGDRVFDERGAICSVNATSEIFENHNCYEVEFSDGEKIVADAGHLWRTDARRKGNGTNGKARSLDDDIRTTAEIAATLRAGNGSRVEWNHSIPVAAPLDTAFVALPIPPYTLGAWLGDGHSASARLTIGHGEEEIVDLVRSEGVSAVERVSASAARLFLLGSEGRGAARKASLQAQLRANGLLNNKHIPRQYLRASVHQRMALLRGLMDTDGTVDRRGHCSFITTKSELKDGVIELLRSLGYKPTCTEERAKLRGRDCGSVWRVRFVGFADRPVFGLERKRRRLKPAPAKRTRSETRQIVGCRPVDSRPVRCIQVDSPSRLYLAGQGMVPTHNSTLTAGVALYCLCCENEPGPQIVIGATTGEQAGKVFNPAKRMVEMTAALREAFDLEAFSRSIVCEMNGGFIQPINAKGKTQDGWNPHVGILDELHAHKDRSLFDVIKSAQGARKNPLLWIITTAGFDTNGVCYEQRTVATKMLDGVVPLDHLFAIIFTLDENDDPFDERIWIKANPMIGITPSFDKMRSDAADAKISPREEGNFKTKNLNLWMNAASAWLNVSQWQACADPTLRWEDFEGLDCYIGGDLADKDDITALVLAAFDAQGRLIFKPRFWLPEAVLKHPDHAQGRGPAPYREWSTGDDAPLTLTTGDWVDHNEVERVAREWIERFSVRRVTFDQFAAATAMASRLNEDLATEDDPLAQILHKNAKNVSDAAKELESRVKSGPSRLRHDGNPVMGWMAANCVVSRRRDETLLPIKESQMSPNKIDGIDALVNAIQPALVTLPDQSSVYEKRGLLVL